MLPFYKSRFLAFSTSALLVCVTACVARNPHQTAAKATPAAPPQKARTVRVFTERDGEVTRFLVENTELCEVTVTFNVSLTNLKPSRELPHTASFPANAVTEAFTVSPIDAAEKWEYSFTNHYKLGDNQACHDDESVYQLPYKAGSRYLVTQAYNGSFSHKGANQFAVDWKMPEGTIVCASREGLVVKVKDDSEKGGASVKFDKYNNFVLIRHDDGTLAHYCHLKRGGVKVQAGERVSAGQPIALSGNTGFSSGPHLHFCVFKAKDGLHRESIPVRFRTASDTAITLVESRRYEAADAVGSATLVSQPALPAAESVGKTELLPPAAPTKGGS